MQPSNTATARTAATLLGGALLLLGASCSGGKNAESTGGGGGAVTTQGNGGVSLFLQDPHFGGVANSIRLVTMSYGRLVELTARNNNGVIGIGTGGLVIRQELQSVQGDYELIQDPVTGRETLFIDRNVDDPAELAELESLVTFASSNLDPIQVRALDSTDVFSMVPRNAAIVMQFDDLLDPATITNATVQLFAGDPPAAPNVPFIGRVFPSSFYGGQTPNGTFFPTRVVFDPTISEIEAAESATLLNINTIGLPPSTNPNLANFQLRIPSRRASSVGLNQIVSNLSGAGLTTNNAGPVDFSSPTRPITRAFRSGGRPDVVTDPNSGFLFDNVPPILVGSTPVEILMDPIQVGGSGSRVFEIPELRFDSTLCGGRPERLDVIVQGGVFAQVEPLQGMPGGTLPDANGITRNVRVRLIAFPDVQGATPAERFPDLWANTGMGPATYESGFDPNADAGRAQCFVQATPQAASFPDDPGEGIQTDTFFTLRFSEPMDPTSLTAFDSLTIARSSFDPMVPTDSSDFVIGSIQQSSDRRDVTFFPRQLLSHLNGTAEPYFLRVADAVNDPFPPTDLSGNPVTTVPEIRFSIDPDAATILNGGRVQRFSALDESPPLGNEWGGQILIDQDRQVLRPRPMLRSTSVIDNEQPMLAQQFYLGQGGVVTPLSPFGSRLQAIWRYVDCSFSVSDQQDMNIDVEGLSWAPAGGSIVSDEFAEFEIVLGHCKRLPDEVINPANGFPQFPASGLETNFSNNFQNSDRDDAPREVVVHDRGRGYTFETGDLFQASSGTALVPFPLNRGIPFDERRYFTWRDTRIRTRAPNQNNGGTEPLQYFLARGLPIPPPVGMIPGYRPFYRSTEAQTAALPLLMEFRVFPDLTAIGQNGWDINIAINSSANPFFRAFRTGGTNTSGSVVTVDPDSTPGASGGFNPGSNPPGAPTPGRDPVVYLGAIDYITRVSQAHSIWFESTIANEGPIFGTRVFDEPTIEPPLSQQPVGTELRTEFRGATNIQYLNDEAFWQVELENWVAAGNQPGTFPQPDPQEGSLDNDGDPQDNDPTPGIPDFRADAFSLDLYGDYYNDTDNWNDTRPTFETPPGPALPRLTSPWPRHYRQQMNPGITFQSDDRWFLDVDGIENARFYQVRLTFVSNPETGRSPEVSAFAMTWSR